jgi:dUTP pyrophosphatase
MNNLVINVVNTSTNSLPHYATHGAAGMDVRAFIESSVTLRPLDRSMISTGLYFEIPEGYEAQVRPRSGLLLNRASPS